MKPSEKLQEHIRALKAERAYFKFLASNRRDEIKWLEGRLKFAVDQLGRQKKFADYSVAMVAETRVRAMTEKIVAQMENAGAF